VALEGREQRPGLGVPYARCLVFRDGNDVVAVRREGGGQDPGIAHESLERCPGLGVPQPRSGVARGGYDAAAIGREGGGIERATVALALQ
jgi:hypothetical protein